MPAWIGTALQFLKGFLGTFLLKEMAANRSCTR
jgi:hypothetical protein